MSAVIATCKRCGREFAQRRGVGRPYKYCSDACRKTPTTYYANNKSRVRNNILRKLYGIGIDEYNALLLAQGGACAICGSKDVGRGDASHFAVDHCHKTGAVRGLLCAKCNLGLGCFSDSPEVLANAIQYLNKARESYDR